MARFHFLVAAVLCAALAACGGEPENTSRRSDAIDGAAGAGGGRAGAGGDGGTGGIDDPGAGGTGGLANGGVGGIGGLAPGGSGGAAVHDWVPVGPSGIRLADLMATQSGTLLGRTGEYNVRSTDGGITWSIVPESDRHWSITEVDGTLYTATYTATGRGLFASTDDGLTWSLFSSDWDVGHTSLPVPGPGGALWAVEGMHGSVRSSSDGGLTWTDVAPSPGHGSRLFSVGGKLYFPTPSHGLVGSVDGVNWTPLGSTGEWISSLVAHGGSLFAHVYAQAGGAGQILRSDDAGLTWVIDDTQLDGEFRCPIHVVGGSLLAVNGDGFFRRDPHAWTRLGDAWSSCPAAAGASTLWTFNDDSRELARWDAGVPDWRLVPVEASLVPVRLLIGNDAVLLANSSDDRTYRSTDRGASWTEVLGQWVSEGVHLGGASWLVSATDGVHTSHDDGATWQLTAAGMRPVGLAVVGAAIYGNLSRGPLPHRSTDGGATWTSMQSSFPPDAVVGEYRTVGSTLFATWRPSGAMQDGTWRSTDDGATFTEVCPVRIESITRVGAALFGFAPSLVRSDDDGVIWHLVQENPPYSEAGMVGRGSDIFMPGGIWGNYPPGDSQILLSSDQGLTWAPFGSALPGDVINLMVTTDHLYAVVRGAGVWSHRLP